MYKPIKYISTGQSPFDSWRIWLYFALFLSLTFYFYDINVGMNPFLVGFVASTALILLITLGRISIITRQGQDLYCNSLLRNSTVEDITNVTTWWAYDFQPPAIKMDEENIKPRARINYIYIFAKITGKNTSVILYELIQLGSKFPNNHSYDATITIEDIDTFKVWDVDACLDRLKLGGDDDSLGGDC